MATEKQDSGNVERQVNSSSDGIVSPEITIVSYPTGIRFSLMAAALAIPLFLTNLEIPIVTTSVVAITNDIGGFDKAGWLISSYLLGYVGVVVIFAKLSDIFGRRPLLATTIITFIIASAACGAAQTPAQLITFRAFQGVGGGGSFALGMTMMTDMGPPEKWPLYGTNVAMLYAISLLAGPIIGGAISERASWRWVFLINIPCALPALVFTFLAIPKGFPHHNSPDYVPRTWRTLFSKDVLRRIDFFGGLLLFLATLTLTAGFQEADSAFPWRSAYVITLLVAAGFLWITLVLWERHVSLANSVREPVMPWSFLTNRVILGLLLDSTFLGGTWIVGVFTLPQKFQIVHGTSALQAGIRTMPFTFAAPLGAAVSSVAAGKFKIPVIFVLFLSAILQIIGYALLATLPKEVAVPARAYGYQIIAGFGCGITISLPALAMPYLVDAKNRAVSLSTVGQVRIMGAAIVLAISTSVGHSYTRPRLQKILGQSDISSAHSSAGRSIPDDAREVIAQGYNLQMIVLCAFGAMQAFAIALLWKKKQVRI